MKKIIFLIYLFCFCTSSYSQIVASENFDTALNWSVVNLSASTNAGWTRQTSGSFPTCVPFAGAGMARFNCFNIDAGDAFELNSPAFTLSGGSYRFKFAMYRDAAYVDNDDRVEVYFNTSAGSTAGTLIGTVSRYNTANAWNNYTFLIPGTPTGTGYISLKAISEYGNNIFVDQIVIENVPSCAEPSALVVSGITPSDATLNWTAPTTAPANGYEYYYSTSSVLPTNATPAAGAVVAGVTNKVLTGLTPATSYYFYVRSVCSGVSSSPWSVGVNFLTACALITSFTENFDSSLSIPICWAKVGTLGSSNVQANATSSSTPNLLYIYSGSTASQAVVSTAAVSNLGAGTHRFKFKMRGNFTAGEDLQIGYLTNPQDASTFISLGSVNAATLTLTQYIFTPAAGSYSNFPAIRPSGSNGYSILIDDFSWEPIPSCGEATTPVASAITTTTAQIAWTAPAAAPANGYEYYVSTSNTSPTAATTVSGAVGAGVTSTTLSGLMQNTNYYFWIRSVCASGSSPWSTTGTFLTACVPVSVLPWTENFDSLAALGASSFPPCWYKENGDWNSSNATTYNTPRSGANYIRDAYSAANEYIWTPGFTLSAGSSYDFSYWTQGDGGTGWTADTFVNLGQRSTLSTPVQLGSTYSYPGTGTFAPTAYTQIKNSFTPSTSGTYYFAVRVNQPSSAPWYVAFDDFKVELTPACTEPAALTASTINLTSASIIWTASPSAALGYDYYFSTTNTAPTNVTAPSGSVGAGITTVGLTGLTSATTYYVWVRSLCTGSVTSAWSNSISFTTLCNTSALPYSIDFESAVVGSIPSCTTVINEGTGNVWNVVSAPGNGFTSKCLSYRFNSTNDANVWFYTNALSLTAGNSYTVSFDYGNNSTNYNESLKVAYGTSKTGSAMTTTIADYPSITGATATSASVNFIPATTGVYYLGFQAYSVSDQFNLYLDNIAIDATLSTNAFDKSGFKFYPNPVTTILNLEYSKDISSVSVYNLLGQEVAVKPINTALSQIDMSGLASGTYLVKIVADGLVNTIKVNKR